MELINVSKEENGKLDYPAVVKSEGIAPSQYGTKGLVGDKLAEVEEKYDLKSSVEGFGTEGEEVRKSRRMTWKGKKSRKKVVTRSYNKYFDDLMIVEFFTNSHMRKEIKRLY